MRKLIIICLLILSFILFVGADWPMYMGNFYMTGNNDEIPPNSNRLNWSFKAPKYISNAISSNLTVYLTSIDGYLYALNEETGRIRWDFNTGKPIITMPVVAEGNVVTSSGRKLFCLDARTGRILWARFDPNYFSQLGTPLIYNGKVIYGTRKVLYARNLRNGHEVWTNDSIEIYGASPVVFDNIVVISAKSYRGNRTSYLVGIDANSGNTLWRTPVEHDPNSFTPLIKDGKIYYGSKNYFYKLNLRDGRKLYTKRFQSNFGSEPKYSNQAIYISGTDGYIYKMSPKTGEVKKKIKHYSRQGAKFIIVGPNIYTSTQGGMLYCIDGNNGKVKWKFKAAHTNRGKILCAANGIAYFTVWDRLYSLSGGALPTPERPYNTAPPFRRLAQSGRSNVPPHSRSRRFNRYSRRGSYGRPYNRRNRSRYTYRRPYTPRYSRRTPRYAYRRGNRTGPPYSYRRYPRPLPRRRPRPRQPIVQPRPSHPTRVAMVQPRRDNIEPAPLPVTAPRTRKIQGTLIDRDTGSAIPGEVIAVPRNDPQGRRRIVARVGPGGSFNLTVPNEDYDITFRSSGYNFTTIPFKKDKKWKKRKIELVKLRQGTSFVVHNIFFDVHKATLKSQSIKELRRAVMLLKKNPSMKIEIQGHTDSTGGAAYNVKFSLKRAEVVRNFMIKHGISPHRLKIRGFGASKPIADNRTSSGRARNRRVEFFVINM